MHMLRNLSRALVVAMSAGWMLTPSTSAAGSLSCTPSSLSIGPDSQGNLTVTCTAPTTTPPTSCTVTATPSLLGSSGGSVLVTATNCGTISSWTGAVAVTPGTSASFTDTLPPNTGATSTAYTYTVAGSGSPSTASATVTVPAPTTTPPPPTGTISCAGYATQVIDIPWPGASTGFTRVSTRGFTNGMIVVGRFTTPSVAGNGGRSKVWAATANSYDPLRTAALSQTPCDFANPNPLGSYAAPVVTTVPSFSYVAGPATSNYAVLQPGTTYYFNIKNEAYGAPTCPAGVSSCDVIIEVDKGTTNW
jgi:hypothetical protein